MADDVTFQSATPATPPAGTVAATDDVGGRHFQIVKLDVGGNGATTPVVGTLPVSGTLSISGDVTVVQPTSTNLRAQVGGFAANGAAVSGNPVLVAGSDGTNARSIKTDSSGELQVDILTLPALPAGSNNIGDVDVLTLPALPAGNNNIGDVDIASVPAPLNVVGNGAAATALRVTMANDSTGVVAATVAGVATAANQTTMITALQLIDDPVQVLGTDTYTEGTSKGMTLGAVRRDADTTLVNTTNEFTPLQTDARGLLKVEAFSGETLPVSLAALPALVAGTANIGDVDIVGGTLASDAPLTTNPLTIGGRASTAVPGAVSADGDVVDARFLRNGAQVVHVVDSAGAAQTFGGGTQYAGDAPATSTPTGTMAMGLAKATVPADVSADNDAVAAWYLRNGVQNVRLVDGTGTALSVGGGTQYTEDVAFGGNGIGNLMIARRDDALSALTPIEDDAVGLRVNSQGALWTAVGAALPAGTNNIGDVDIVTLPALVAGTANIGDVDVLTVPADPFGVNADAASATGSISAKLRFIAATGIPITSLPASTNTIEVVGDVAHDAAAAGNPVLNAGIAQDTDDTAPPNRVSAEGDATRFATDRDGSLYVRTHGPQVWSYHDDDVAAVTTDGTVHAAPGAGLSLYVTDIVFSIGAATASSIFLEESTTKVLGPYYLDAVAGRGLHIHFATPKKITANTALLVTNTGSISFGIDITGFTAQG